MILPDAIVLSSVSRNERYLVSADVDPESSGNHPADLK